MYRGTNIKILRFGVVDHEPRLLVLLVRIETRDVFPTPTTPSFLFCRISRNIAS
jgi:hypothetical protein